MPDSKERTSLDKLGIDVNSSRMMMLKAVMAAAGGTSRLVTYKDIADNLEEIQKKKYSHSG